MKQYHVSMHIQALDEVKPEYIESKLDIHPVDAGGCFTVTDIHIEPIEDDVCELTSGEPSSSA